MWRWVLGIGGALALALVAGYATSTWNPAWDWVRAAEIVAVLVATSAAFLLAFTIAKVYSHFGQIVSAQGAMLTMVYELAWAVLLALAAVDYVRGEPIEFPHMIGSLPTPVLWFGAVGGVLISLAGVADRTADGSWQDRWVPWHMLRPVVGVVVAVISVLIFQAGILSLGGTANPQGQASTTYYLIAFVAAYRESTFRDLVKRLADSILNTGTGGPTIQTITPSSGGGGEVALTGSGLAAVSAVQFGAVSLVPTTQTATYVLLANAPNRAQATAGMNVASGDSATVTVVASGTDGAAATTYTYPGA